MSQGHDLAGIDSVKVFQPSLAVLVTARFR